MPKKMKGEECCDMEHIKRKKKMMGAGLLVLGLILYAKEVGLLGYAGSIWSLAMILVGIAVLVKGLTMCKC